LAISISDGISTSMLEAMAMGSFPIQTSTSCANEWIKDRDTGFIVDPDNVGQIARRLKRALTDDFLVDAAAPRNAAVIRDRANPESIRRRVEAAYLRAAA
jgi:glycosyltransferase involved in cell wall biosynthesis